MAVDEDGPGLHNLLSSSGYPEGTAWNGLRYESVSERTELDVGRHRSETERS